MKAAYKAKKDFNLVTTDSINTMISIRDEDNEIS